MNPRPRYWLLTYLVAWVPSGAVSAALEHFVWPGNTALVLIAGPVLGVAGWFPAKAVIFPWAINREASKVMGL